MSGFRVGFELCSSSHITQEQFLLYSDFSVFIHYVPGKEALAQLKNKCFHLVALLARKQHIHKLRIAVIIQYEDINDQDKKMTIQRNFDTEPLLEIFGLVLGGINKVEIICVLDYGRDRHRHRLDLLNSPFGKILRG